LSAGNNIYTSQEPAFTSPAPEYDLLLNQSEGSEDQIKEKVISRKAPVKVLVKEAVVI